MLFLKHRRQFDFDVGRLAPVDGNPRVGRHEMEGGGVSNDDDFVFLAGVFLHFKGHGDAANAGTDEDNFSHDSSPLRVDE